MQNTEIQFLTIGPYSDFMCRKDAAKYLNMSLPLLDQLMAMSKSGKLNPPLPVYRAKPNGKPFYRKSKLDEWVKLRELAKT